MNIAAYVTLVKSKQLSEMVSNMKHIEKKKVRNQNYINKLSKKPVRNQKTVNSYRKDMEKLNNKVEDLKKLVQLLKITTAS